MAILGPSRELLVPSLAAYTAAFLALIHLLRHHSGFLDDPRVLLGGALLLRVTLFPSLPDLSDDLYRYVWDGWMTHSGIDPFRFVPADPSLSAFHDSVLFREMNSVEYRSIYPPASQLVFLLGGWSYEALGWPGSAYVVKGGFLVLEMVGITCIYLAMRAMRIRPGPLALYAWNPLVLVTVAGGGHTEGGLILGLGLFAYGVAAGGRKRAWLGLVLAAAAKGIPLLLAPLLLRRHMREVGPAELLKSTLPALAVGLILLAPFNPATLGSAAIASADLYVRWFEFNAGPYLLLKQLLTWVTGEDWSKVLGPSLRWGFFAATVLIWIRWPVVHREDVFRGCLLLFGTYLVTATTIHPWYLNWGLALLPLTPFLRGTWLWASWAAFLTYFTYVGVPHGWLTGIFWTGTIAFLWRDGEGDIRDRLLRWAGRRKASQVSSHIRGRHTLDLGAGEGYVARHLDLPHGKVFLMDLGPYFKVGLPGVIYDGERIPLGDKSVDTVLISLALHHARDPDRVVAEAIRVARTQLVVTESTYRGRWERRLLEFADRWANRGRGMDTGDAVAPPLSFRTVPEWEACFRRSGGTVIVSRRLNRLGHRHHLFVIDPNPRGRASIHNVPDPQKDSNPEKISAGRPPSAGGPPLLAPSSSTNNASN